MEITNTSLLEETELEEDAKKKNKKGTPWNM